MSNGWIKVSALAAALTLGLAATAGAQQDPTGGQQGPSGGQQAPSGGQQGPSGGQQQGGQQQGGQQQAPSELEEPQPEQPAFTSQQKKRFVDAYLEIIEIQERYTADIEETDGGEEARKLQEEANDKMVTAIEDNDLSVPEYSEIANAMDMNPELRDEISSMIEERRDQ